MVFLLFFVLVAYIVLLKDIWTPVLLKCFPELRYVFLPHTADAYDGVDSINDEDMQKASHYMLIALVMAALL